MRLGRIALIGFHGWTGEENSFSRGKRLEWGGMEIAFDRSGTVVKMTSDPWFGMVSNRRGAT
jgi:hypothetical protein